MTLVTHKSKGLTPEILAELKALSAMPDDTIDLSDMPEVTDFTGWVRGKFYRPMKKQVTLRLDADVIEWFKTQQGGARGYQTAINAALRGVVEGERRKAG
ncbi:MAG: BrnA antitoxin family protein [Usitatibacteraceae bacterium]